jgi:glycosyltransferase involved in cell wall biosynthesis
VRVLVITDLFPPVAFGGYERTCEELVEGLRSHHEVTVLTSELKNAVAPDAQLVRRELPYLGPRRRELARVPAAAARAARSTRAAIAALRPHVVYVSNCLGIPQAAPLAAVESGTPVVYRLSELWFASTLYRGDRFVGHLFPGQRGLHQPWSWVVGAANRHPALRLDPTRPSRAAISWCSNELRRRVTLPASVEPVLERTIHSGVTDRFGALARRPDEGRTIVYAGRVTTAKGAEVAIQALALLGESHGIEARLVLAGHCDARMARRVESLAGELGVGDRVELLGELGSEQLGRLFQRAHALVVPTVAHEAFGRICVEGALARVPVVASRIGGIPEALRDLDHALLFPPGDAQACGDALAGVFQDPVAARARAARAYAHAQRFSAKRFVDASEALLEEAAETLGAS